MLRSGDTEGCICTGMKMLEEAEKAGAKVTSILWKDEPGVFENCPVQYCAPGDLFDYACPQKNSPGPVFTAIPMIEEREIHSAIVLENVQDPGNVGTVIRTANAFGIDAVYLLGDCARLSNPKTVRATMGSCFWEQVIEQEFPSIPVYAAVLRPDAKDLREMNLKNCAVAIGSEGHGLSEELIAKCAGSVIIPMTERAESLNAAVAASVCMWEISR